MAKQLSNGLTPRQTEIFLYLDQFARSNGFPPSLREIGSNFKIAASSVLDHLKVLEKKGFIKRIPFKPRCLEILRKDVGE